MFFTMSSSTASMVVPWVVYLMSPRYSLPDALSPYALWAAMWPIVVGIVLAWVLVNWKRRLPEVPSGDVLIVLAPIGRCIARGVSDVAVALDTALRRWPLTGWVLLGLLLAFAVAVRT